MIRPEQIARECDPPLWDAKSQSPRSLCDRTMVLLCDGQPSPDCGCGIPGEAGLQGAVGRVLSSVGAVAGPGPRPVPDSSLKGLHGSNSPFYCGPGPLGSSSEPRGGAGAAVCTLHWGQRCCGHPGPKPGLCKHCGCQNLAGELVKSQAPELLWSFYQSVSSAPAPPPPLMQMSPKRGNPGRSHP